MNLESHVGRWRRILKVPWVQHVFAMPSVCDVPETDYFSCCAMDAVGEQDLARLPKLPLRYESNRFSLNRLQHFCEYLSDPFLQKQILYSNFLSSYLDGILYNCHKAIIGKNENVWHAGTTTLCGGIIMKVLLKASSFVYSF